MLHCLTFLPVSVLSPHLVIDLASNQHKDKMVENCLLAYIDFYIYEMKWGVFKGTWQIKSARLLEPGLFVLFILNSTNLVQGGLEKAQKHLSF